MWLTSWISWAMPRPLAVGGLLFPFVVFTYFLPNLQYFLDTQLLMKKTSIWDFLSKVLPKWEWPVPGRLYSY